MEEKRSDLHLSANLEEARFQSEKEMAKNYAILDWNELKDKEIIGTPIMAKEENSHLKIAFSKPSHTLVLGTTGSGKTATFVNPSIQILSELKNHPSMLISDPKGELYQKNAKALKEKGYEVKVLDLRNPYNSVRWNPPERPCLLHQRASNLEKGAIQEDGIHRFDNEEYETKEEVDAAIRAKRRLLFDEACGGRRTVDYGLGRGLKGRGRHEAVAEDRLGNARTRSFALRFQMNAWAIALIALDLASACFLTSLSTLNRHVCAIHLKKHPADIVPRKEAIPKLTHKQYMCIAWLKELGNGSIHGNVED